MEKVSQIGKTGNWLYDWVFGRVWVWYCGGGWGFGLELWRFRVWDRVCANELVLFLVQRTRDYFGSMGLVLSLVC